MCITIEEATALLQSGKVVAIPTETVYGLAASMENPLAIEEIFRLKLRPQNNPLIVHLRDAKQIERYAISLPYGFFSLAENFWPGPLTIVVEVANDLVPEVVRAKKKTCAFRVPKHKTTQKLLQNISPLVAPSANLSGKPSSTRREHIISDFGADFPVLEGDICKHGVESTIVFFEQGRWVIVRQGAITVSDLESVLGYPPEKRDSASNEPLCPGQLFKHYAPMAKLFLSDAPYDGKVTDVVGFSNRSYPGACRFFSLGEDHSAELVAHSLYEALRALDTAGVTEAWVDMQMPGTGLWQTIRERLCRAAH